MELTPWRPPQTKKYVDSAESRALRRSYSVFKRGVDPQNLLTQIYSELLFTREEKEKVSNMHLTDSERLEEMFVVLERRVSVKPEYFHVVLEKLNNEPALKEVGSKMQDFYDEECKLYISENSLTGVSVSAATKNFVPSAPVQRINIQCFTSSLSDKTQPQLQSKIQFFVSSQEVHEKIKELQEQFHALKNTIRECLESNKISVNKVADVLTSLSPDGEHQSKIFLEDHVKVIFQAANHSELFGTMNFHWNYLNPPMLEHLVKMFNLDDMKGMMEKYMSDLRSFRMKTPLILYCRTQKRRNIKLSPGFHDVVVNFNWPDDVTLEIVEQFREEYASQYNLHECAMMLTQISHCSFIVTWFVPEAIVEKLKEKIPRKILKKYLVSQMTVDGVCIFRRHKVQLTTSTLISSTNSTVLTKSMGISVTPVSSELDYIDLEYPFVEQPSDDFFCPVTSNLLLKPRLTSCCGNHLSQEAVDKIKVKRGPCPLCKTSAWQTMLNKQFQRKVNSLRVFCCNVTSGCEWQGNVSDFDLHVKSCQNKPLSMSGEEQKFISGYSDCAEAALETDNVSIQQPLAMEVKSQATAHPYFTQFKSRKLTVECYHKKIAPWKMIRGSATKDMRFAYFAIDAAKTVLSFEWSTEIWDELPQCPYYNAGLVVVDGELNAVGGKDATHYTNKMFTLEHMQWVEKYPPMNTAHSSHAIVNTIDNRYVIVIGGYGGHNKDSSTVELLHVKSRTWHKLVDIPQYLQIPSVTLCGDDLYVIGAHNGYFCSLEALPAADEEFVPTLASYLISWEPLPSLPLIWATAATLCDQLVIVGGGDESSPVNSIYQLLDGQWVEVGNMLTGRWRCLVVSQSPNTILIAGGVGAQNNVEECVVKSL